MVETPSTNGANGRDTRGRLVKGNAGGPGNPHVARVGELRAAMLKALTPAAVRRAVAALIREAEKDNVQAIRELLDRAVGRPVEADLIERLDKLKQHLQKEEPAWD